MRGLLLICLLGLMICSVTLAYDHEEHHEDHHEDEHHDEEHHEEGHHEEEEEKIKYDITSEAWLDISVRDSWEKNASETYLGRITIGLFGDICPMTTTNFFQLCKGVKRGDKKLTYAGSPFHRIVRDFVIQGGDIVDGDGTGSQSIYGDKFIDENYSLSHRSAGWVSMANYGSDTNGSQFFITLVPSRWLDGHHVVFGRVLSGMNIVREISDTKVYKGTSLSKKKIVITKSGVKTVNRYELIEEQLDSPGDIHHNY